MRTVIEALRERARRQPERTALACGERRVSLGELLERVETVAAHLSERGVRPGERVMLDAPSVPAFVFAYFATHLVGAIAVPVDPSLPASRREELRRRVSPALELTAEALAALEVLPARQGAFSGPKLDAVADLIFTTGTTGRPKGVPLTHRNLATAASHINAVIGTGEGDVDLIPIPLYHAFGLGSLRCFLVGGASVVLVQGFRLPGEIFVALERHGATGMIGVPAGFAILLRFGERGLGALAERLRYIEIGSAPMPLEQKRELMRLLPRTRLFMHYGLTEAARSAFSEFHRDHERLDSVGKPSPGVSVEARDASGAPCPAGTPGMLWVHGAHVSPGYWDDDELSAATFVNGWMRTGDFGHVDAAGYVVLHSRHDDLINVGGAKVAPDEVERVLAEHPAVSEAGCVGVPDPRGIAGQVVRAFLVAAPGAAPASDAELSRWAARQLEAHKIPAQYEWVEALPRTASGKLIRAALRKEKAKA
jgi:long-chain acyl-CoA synthetase